MPAYRDPNFRQLPAPLGDLFDAAARRSFFALPAWYELMARHGVAANTVTRIFSDERPGSAAALVVRECEDEGGRRLVSLANAYSVEHGIMYAPGSDLKRALAAVLAEILDEDPRWDGIALNEFDPGDPAYRSAVSALRGAGFLVECVFDSGTWFENTAGMRFCDYLAARPSELRNTWRRKRRRAQRAGRLRTDFFKSPVGLDQAIADYETVYARSWKPAEAFPHLIPALIRLAAEKAALRLAVARIDDIPAAVQFWIVWRGRAVIYKLAHDTRFDALSLGTLLTMDLVERVLEEDRPAEINFGRGDDPYKKLWLPRRRERWGIRAANPRTLRGLRFGLKREAAKVYHRLRGKALAPPG
jgi:hypothetical protein